ncbi:MAG TPA: hypothetical protein VLA29_02050 [Acidimicrobiia bacterium]|nr:hypothetical protein [Acidimicrobiia bacterium]
MARPHLIIGIVALSAVVVGSLAVAVDPDPIARSAVPMLTAGLLVCSLVGLAGLLLARAPWGRVVLVGTVVITMVAASAGETPLTWAAFIVGGIALVGLLGPWLTLWIRHHRLTDAPGTTAIVLIAVGAGAPLFLGLVLVGTGAAWYHWMLAGVTIVGSLLYGRGNRIGLWTFRTVTPMIAVIVGLATAGIAGLAIAVAGLAIGVAAWTPSARHTTTVIAPVLPQPIDRRT